jgi:hypothetical protein
MVSANLPDLSLDLRSPRQCVQPPQPFAVCFEMSFHGSDEQRSLMLVLELAGTPLLELLTDRLKHRPPPHGV